MRFNRRNWRKYFDGSNKKTTIRLRKSKIGHHKAYAGSYFKPEVLGEFDVTKVIEIKYKELTEQDAKDDGFNSLYELKVELINLNGSIDHETTIYQIWTENVKEIENAAGKSKTDRK